jgi:hypothetical protein
MSSIVATKLMYIYVYTRHVQLGSAIQNLHARLLGVGGGGQAVGVGRRRSASTWLACCYYRWLDVIAPREGARLFKRTLARSVVVVLCLCCARYSSYMYVQ